MAATPPGAGTPPPAPRKPVLSTMWAGEDVRWHWYVDVLDSRDHTTLPQWLLAFLRLSRGRQAVVLRGTVTLRERYRDLVGAIALNALRSPVRVVISDATIEPGSKALAARLGPAARVLPALSRALVRAADGPRVTWCVLSTEEVDSFSRTWGVPQSRIAFTPFSHTLFAPEDRRPTGHGTFVFSGGNSLRDYPLLVEAADGLGCEVVLATGWRPAQRKHWLTAESVPHERFVELMRQCRVMVLPLAPSTRSAGQQTYLNAMALGKVVIVTDGPGVRDHIDDGVTGVIVERTVEGLRAALRDVLDPARAEHYERMGQRARAKALVDYSPDTYRRSLLRLAGVTD